MIYKLLIHINEESKFPMLFSNVSNFVNRMEELKSDYSIIVVINGSAVTKVLDDSTLINVSKTMSTKVVYKVCENSLRGRNVDISDHLDKYTIVGTSVVEIAERQILDKFAYIKL